LLFVICYCENHNLAAADEQIDCFEQILAIIWITKRHFTNKENMDMAAKRTVRRREWTKQDLRDLKMMARERTPARRIGRKLRRTEGAVRQKAYAAGISLSLRSRSAKKRGK
jgi:hypothetical protein